MGGMDWNYILGNLGHGLSQGYVMGLQRQMQETAALKRMLMQQDAAARARREQFQDTLTLDRLKREANAREARDTADLNFLTTYGPEEAEARAQYANQLNPASRTPRPMDDEPELGEIGWAYGVPIPGATAERRPFLGTKALDEASAIRKETQRSSGITQRQLDKEERAAERDRRDRERVARFRAAIEAGEMPDASDLPVSVQGQFTSDYLTSKREQGREERKGIAEAKERAEKAMGDREERKRVSGATGRPDLADLPVSFQTEVYRQQELTKRKGMPSGGAKGGAKGRGPTELDKDTAAWVKKFQGMKPIPAKPGLLGFGGSPEVSVDEQIQGMIDQMREGPGKRAAIRAQQAFHDNEDAAARGETEGAQPETPTPRKTQTSKATPARTPSSSAPKTAEEFLKKYHGVR